MLPCDTISRVLVDSACRMILIHHYRGGRPTLAGGEFGRRLIHAHYHLGRIICNQFFSSLIRAHSIGLSHELIRCGLLLRVGLRPRRLFTQGKLVRSRALVAEPLDAALTLVT